MIWDLFNLWSTLQKYYWLNFLMFFLLDVEEYFAGGATTTASGNLGETLSVYLYKS